MANFLRILNASTGDNWGTKLTDTYLALDQELKDHHQGGATAITAAITSNTIFVANAGDCRAVLSVGGVARRMSRDHKPQCKEFVVFILMDKMIHLAEQLDHECTGEAIRIYAAGGYIERNCIPKHRPGCLRVNGRIESSFFSSLSNLMTFGNPYEGNLATSRALGDFQFKREDLPHHKQIVTAHPEIISCSIDDQAEFLVLASGGKYKKCSLLLLFLFVDQHFV